MRRNISSAGYRLVVEGGIYIKVLIVDDQVNVQQGMLAGIDWKRLQVEEILTASDAVQAKGIIRKKKIDVLLCDIEMPGEDGLSLFRWTKEYNPNIECIFLTAHANFDYIKESMNFGGFDYILQPAKYEDIERTIIRVTQKIIMKRELQRYSDYGKRFYNKKDQFVEESLKNFLLKGDVGMDEMIQNLKILSVYIQSDTMVYDILIQILAVSFDVDKAGRKLLQHTFSNVLSELLRVYGCNIITVQIDEDYFILVYSDAEKFIELEQMKETLFFFKDICSESLGVDVACYTGNVVRFDSLPGRTRDLMAMKWNNVAKQSDIFAFQGVDEGEEDAFLPSDMKQWKYYLVGKRAEDMRQSAFVYLDNRSFNLYLLKQFYQELMHIVSGACEEIGITIYQLFSDKDIFEKSLSCYRSIEEMKEIISYIVEYFKTVTTMDETDYVELMIQYIHRNIDQDLRRSDLAVMLNLNEDYISRIFKRKMGVTLKEFILTEKMKVAEGLIVNTALPIGTIALKVGFTHFSYFSQMYKKIMGVNPAEQRILKEIK